MPLSKNAWDEKKHPRGKGGEFGGGKGPTKSPKPSPKKDEGSSSGVTSALTHTLAAGAGGVAGLGLGAAAGGVAGLGLGAAAGYGQGYVAGGTDAGLTPEQIAEIIVGSPVPHAMPGGCNTSVSGTEKHHFEEGDYVTMSHVAIFR